jgi:hypothetical protein
MNVTEVGSIKSARGLRRIFEVEGSLIQVPAPREEVSLELTTPPEGLPFTIHLGSVFWFCK